MKIITYLAFTVLSIAIQFVVMDLIQDKINIRKTEDGDASNVTSPQRLFKDILQQYNNKSHALYYRTLDNRLERSVPRIFNNSLQEITLETSTDMSTMIDLLYDDNTTVTEDAFSFSSEPFFTTTIELDNVTEINIFTKANTTEKPNVIPKRHINKDCYCNFLYKVCDINCCCDRDCTDSDLKLFNCNERALGSPSEGYSCNSPLSLSTYSVGSNIQNLLCIAKNNLPDKRNIIRNKHDPTILNKTFKWNARSYGRNIPKFAKSFYKYGDPIWLIKNHSIFTLDMPFATLNDYCNEKHPIKVLVQQKTNCNVKLSDLEMLQILNNLQDTSVISVIDKTMNATIMNCSTLHCTNWSIVLCDENNCTKFDNKTHNPLCTENICSPLALKIDYMFHYYKNKIMNATITMYTKKVPLRVPLIQQQINVDFYITNVTAENIVEFNGNPGYIVGLPVIISYHKSNYSENFMSETLKTKKHLVYVDNKGGACSKASDSRIYVLFGNNKRMKCRYHYKMKQRDNETEHCKNLQRNIYKLLGFTESISVSPLGDPRGLKDNDWLTMKIDVPESFLYGKLNEQNTKLHCHNFVNRFSMIFTFADTSEVSSKQKLKILSAKVVITPANVTFDVDDTSIVVTIDTTFIDETKGSVYEYAGGPQLNIHLPSDFFFPFHANEVNSRSIPSILLLMKTLILVYFSK